MNNTYVTGLLHIDFPKLDGKGVEVANGIWLANNGSFRKQTFFSETIWNQVGGIETEFFLQASGVLYRLEDAIDDTEPPVDQLSEFMHACILFLNSLWLVKDNAANFEQAYLFSDTPKGMRATSNSIAVRYARHDGTTDSVSFTIEELHEAINIAKATVKLSNETGDPTKMSPEHPRIARALYWSQAARAADDLAGRVALNCTALETIASTTSAELTHQLSERVAYLLADSPIERIEIYGWMKKCYAFRSKMVHGEAINRKQHGQLAEASERVDGYLRQLIRMIASDDATKQLFDLNTQELHGAMVRLVLGEKLDEILSRSHDGEND